MAGYREVYAQVLTDPQFQAGMCQAVLPLMHGVFGYYALQLGGAWDMLRACRMPHLWHVDAEVGGHTAVCADYAALPFPSDQIDVVVLAHILEQGDAADAVLHESTRVLIPEGHILICGINPFSFAGIRLTMTRDGDVLRHLWTMGRVRAWLEIHGYAIRHMAAVSPSGDPPMPYRKRFVYHRMGYVVMAQKRVAHPGLGRRLRSQVWRPTGVACPVWGRFFGARVQPPG